MNWDAIGALAELGGAIAVIATLLYLSRQIRDNTKSVKIQTLDSTFKEWNEHLKDVQMMEGTGVAFYKAQKGEPLTEIEEFQLGFQFRRVFNTFAKLHYLRSVDAVDLFNSESIETGLPYIMEMDFFKKWWPQHRERYAEVFRQYIDKRIEAPPNKTIESDT